jgi:hypothetical protein
VTSNAAYDYLRAPPAHGIAWPIFLSGRPMADALSEKVDRDEGQRKRFVAASCSMGFREDRILPTLKEVEGLS